MAQRPLTLPAMPDTPLIDQISERVERLLLRHDELRRTNELLAEQVRQLTHERDSLKSRLLAARARVDAGEERAGGVAPAESGSFRTSRARAR